MQSTDKPANFGHTFLDCVVFSSTSWFFKCESIYLHPRRKSALIIRILSAARCGGACRFVSEYRQASEKIPSRDNDAVFQISRTILPVCGHSEIERLFRRHIRTFRAPRQRRNFPRPRAFDPASLLSMADHVILPCCRGTIRTVFDVRAFHYSV